MGARFPGRNAIVTGASRGIGAALAERFAAEGANVALVARTVSAHDHLAGSLDETLARCRRHGARAEAIAADLADAESRSAIVPHALELFGGRIDVLVNHAAAAIYQPAREFPLKRRRASKAAQNRMTAAFAAELQGSGVRVNTIEPRAAVMSEGAEALIGGTLPEELIESMEAMVEGTLRALRLPARPDGPRAREPRPARRAGPHRDAARREPPLPGRPRPAPR